MLLLFIFFYIFMNHKKYTQEELLERQKISQKKYYLKNKQKAKEYNRLYYLSHKEKRLWVTHQKIKT